MCEMGWGWGVRWIPLMYTNCHSEKCTLMRPYIIGQIRISPICLDCLVFSIACWGFSPESGYLLRQSRHVASDVALGTQNPMLDHIWQVILQNEWEEGVGESEHDMAETRACVCLSLSTLGSLASDRHQRFTLLYGKKTDWGSFGSWALVTKCIRRSTLAGSWERLRILHFNMGK